MLKKKLLITVAIILIATVLLIFFYIDPNVYPFFPQCPFRVITGFECPGCGSQRAFHQLLHLNIAGAFRHNPLVVLYGPYLLLGFYLEYLGGNIKFPRIQRLFFGKHAAVVILISIIAFWIGRNIF
jgi:hypothetical protein